MTAFTQDPPDPSLQQAYMTAFGLHLDAKIDKAIALLQHYQPLAFKFSQKGYELSFSGGKDSCVIRALSAMAAITYQPWYYNTTIDPPELRAFMRHQHPDLNVRTPAIPLLKLAEQKGLPTRHYAWCCENYKEQPSDNSVRILGVRHAESPKRLRWKQLTAWRGTWALAPILFWTDDNVWEFIRRFHLPVCELYDQGCTRLGCVACPKAGGPQQARDFARWPHFRRAWQRAARRHWQSHHDKFNSHGKRFYCSRFDSPDIYFAWWTSRHPSPKDDPCQMPLW